MAEPLASILINAFNAERHIRGALDSALAQTYRNSEIVVLDDCSTDGTAAIVAEYRAKDKRVRYVKTPKRVGSLEGRNVLLREARGEYLSYLDTDDRYLPEKTTAEVEFLAAHPEIDLVYCATEYFFDGEPQKIYRNRLQFYSGADVFPHLLEKMFITNTAIMFRRSLYEKVGGYRSDLGIVEDWEYFLRLNYHGYRIQYFDQPLVRICLRSDNQTNFKFQAVVQGSAVQIFEDLKKQMDSDERARYCIDHWIVKRKETYAIALAGNGEGRKAREILKEISPHMGFAKRMGIWFLTFLPAPLAGLLIEQAWKIRKKNLYYPV